MAWPLRSRLSFENKVLTNWKACDLSYSSLCAEIFKKSYGVEDIEDQWFSLGGIFCHPRTPRQCLQVFLFVCYDKGALLTFSG